MSKRPRKQLATKLARTPADATSSLPTKLARTHLTTDSYHQPHIPVPSESEPFIIISVEAEPHHYRYADTLVTELQKLNRAYYHIGDLYLAQLLTQNYTTSHPDVTIDNDSKSLKWSDVGLMHRGRMFDQLPALVRMFAETYQPADPDTDTPAHRLAIHGAIVSYMVDDSVLLAGDDIKKKHYACINPTNSHQRICHVHVHLNDDGTDHVDAQDWVHVHPSAVNEDDVVDVSHVDGNHLYINMQHATHHDLPNLYRQVLALAETTYLHAKQHNGNNGVLCDSCKAVSNVLTTGYYSQLAHMRHAINNEVPLISMVLCSQTQLQQANGVVAEVRAKMKSRFDCTVLPFDTRWTEQALYVLDNELSQLSSAQSSHQRDLTQRVLQASTAATAYVATQFACALASTVVALPIEGVCKLAFNVVQALDRMQATGGTVNCLRYVISSICKLPVNYEAQLQRYMSQNVGVELQLAAYQPFRFDVADWVVSQMMTQLFPPVKQLKLMNKSIDGTVLQQVARARDTLELIELETIADSSTNTVQVFQHLAQCTQLLCLWFGIHDVRNHPKLTASDVDNILTPLTTSQSIKTIVLFGIGDYNTPFDLSLDILEQATQIVSRIPQLQTVDIAGYDMTKASLAPLMQRNSITVLLLEGQKISADLMRQMIEWLKQADCSLQALRLDCCDEDDTTSDELWEQLVHAVFQCGSMRWFSAQNNELSDDLALTVAECITTYTQSALQYLLLADDGEEHGQDVEMQPASANAVGKAIVDSKSTSQLIVCEVINSDNNKSGICKTAQQIMTQRRAELQGNVYTPPHKPYMFVT